MNSTRGSSDTLYSDPWYEYPSKDEPKSFAGNIFRRSGRFSKRMYNKAKQQVKQIVGVAKGVDEDSDKDSGVCDTFSLTQEIEDVRDDQSLFHQLKTERDMEMLKIHQASRALKMLKAQKKYDVSEEILIERIILESSAKQKLILDRIQQLGYAVVDKKAFGATGLLSISNIVVPFSTTDHLGEYYVLQSTVGLNIWLSKAEVPINGCLKFSQSLTFDNVPSNFVVLLQVYRLKYDVQSSKKKKGILNKVCKISFDDVHTLHHEEPEVFQTSFQLVGQIKVTRELLRHPKLATTLKNVPPNCNFRDIYMDLKLDNINFDSKLRTFLNVGENVEGRIFWERKWCESDGPLFNFYNYPSEVDFREPTVSFCLKKGTEMIITDPLCPRKRSFSLTNFKSIGRFDKLYFMAENCQDYEQCTQHIKGIIHSLKVWND